MRADTALPVVRRLQARFPDCDIAVVVDPTAHGPNRKVANLINMLPAAKHDALVIADADVHVAADWLWRLVAALEAPGVGLVTTVYTGLPAHGPLPPTPSRKGRGSLPLAVSRLGAMQINHYFLPGALLARAMGRQDCLGATMALRRETLERIGGFAALVNHLADDNVLGRLVQGLGLRVALADTVPATTVPETTLGALWRHELRWARTIRALVPVQFAASVLQYPLVWAVLAVLLAGGAPWSLGWFAARLGRSRAGRSRHRPGAGPCQSDAALASAGARAYVGGRDGRELCRPPRRLARPHHASGGVRPAMMKTLFLHPPSFDGFDGGAGSRYQARREIRSFWYPTWLAQPAALVPGSKLIDAPPRASASMR